MCTANRSCECSLTCRNKCLKKKQLCMSFPPHIGKKIFLPPLWYRGHSEMSVRLCVCASVHLSVPAKKRNNFWTGCRISLKFSGVSEHSWRVIFGWVARAPGPNGVYGKFISSMGFGLAGLCRTSLERGGRGRQNDGSRILNFCPCREKTGTVIFCEHSFLENRIKKVRAWNFCGKF